MIASPSVEQVIEVASNCGRDGYGCEAVFAKINTHWGLKIYHAGSDLGRRKRDMAYKNQVYLNALGLAPDVGVKFEIDLPEGNNLKLYEAYDNKYFGYVTQVADETLQERACRLKWDENRVYELRRAIRDAIEFHGGGLWSDNLSCNVGYIDDVLLVIDCGRDMIGHNFYQGL